MISKVGIGLNIVYVYITDLRFVHFAERDSEIQSNYQIFPSLLRPYSKKKKIYI